jgi:multiple sugar transport system ATP-binding protein
VAGVAFEDVGKVYPGGTRAVHGLNLRVNDGEFMVFVGPSGCGKTTALRMVAGLEEISEGVIRIGERIVNHVSPKDRDIAMVFQNYALYPHLDVFENMAFGLKLKKTPKHEITRRVRDISRILGLEAFLKRKPRALSGGQRQRVAMGRAIVRNPQVFLMDEPLSNLDAKLRVQTRAEVSRMQEELGVTTIYVTHDQVEAMTMGDRVAVIRKGELQQVADPQSLYRRPVNLFVAGFIGSPAMNFVEAELARSKGNVFARVGDQNLQLDPQTVGERPILEKYIGGKVVLGVRPEDLEDATLVVDTTDGRRLRANVKLTEELGSEVLVHFEVAAPPVLTEEVRELAEDVDEVALAALEQERTERRTVFVGRFGARSRARAGEPVEVAVDIHNLHFFDLETGLAIYGREVMGRELRRER